jgi:hypothetical protein
MGSSNKASKSYEGVRPPRHRAARRDATRNDLTPPENAVRDNSRGRKGARAAAKAVSLEERVFMCVSQVVVIVDGGILSAILQVFTRYSANDP